MTESRQWERTLSDTMASIDSAEEERQKDLQLADFVLAKIHERRSEIFSKLLSAVPQPIDSSTRQEVDQRISDVERMAHAVAARKKFPEIEAAVLSFREEIEQKPEETLTLLRNVSHPRYLDAIDLVCAHASDQPGSVRENIHKEAARITEQRHVGAAIHTEALRRLEALKA
ncbi:hypothetical protein HY969_04620 [Candidatus Kaiserbacteria bacterium]|nr:hypothetical protein [Candidatus Kaiserbacteria bacterium]